MDLRDQLIDAIDDVLHYVYMQAIHVLGPRSARLAREFQAQLQQMATTWASADVWRALPHWSPLMRARFDAAVQRQVRDAPAGDVLLLACSVGCARVLYRDAHLFYLRYSMMQPDAARDVRTHIAAYVERRLADTRVESSDDEPAEATAAEEDAPYDGKNDDADAEAEDDGAPAAAPKEEAPHEDAASPPHGRSVTRRVEYVDDDAYAFSDHEAGPASAPAPTVPDVPDVNDVNDATVAVAVSNDANDADEGSVVNDVNDAATLVAQPEGRDDPIPPSGIRDAPTKATKAPQRRRRAVAPPPVMDAFF